VAEPVSLPIASRYCTLPSRIRSAHGSSAAFALTVSAHPAGIRAIFLIGTAFARLNREPFAALYTRAQVQVPVNRQDKLSPKCVKQAMWRMQSLAEALNGSSFNSNPTGTPTHRIF
jgi:hypothetical protein